MQYADELETTINDMVQRGRGILAADESAPTIAKRFKAINVVHSPHILWHLGVHTRLCHAYDRMG